MNKFKIGSKIQAINEGCWSPSEIKIGKIYTIKHICNPQELNGKIYIKLEEKELGEYLNSFKLIETKNYILDNNSNVNTEGWSNYNKPFQKKWEVKKGGVIFKNKNITILYSNDYFISNSQYFKNNYNLSQEEIDQILKDIGQQKDQQMDFGIVNLPQGSSIDFAYLNQKQKCDHDWKEYTGLKHTDIFCTKCKEIKK